MWIASFRHNAVLQLVFLTLWITFLLLAFGEWSVSSTLHMLGGYTGLVCVNADYGRVVLPIRRGGHTLASSAVP
jgi:uncharacterized protein